MYVNNFYEKYDFVIEANLMATTIKWSMALVAV
jgi:hypothetical protein